MPLEVCSNQKEEKNGKHLLQMMDPYPYIFSVIPKVSGDRNDDCRKWTIPGGELLFVSCFFVWASLDAKTLQRWWFYGTQVTALVMESSHWSDRCTERGDADRPIKILSGNKTWHDLFTVLSEAFKGRFEVFCCLFLGNIACLMCHMPQAFPRRTHVTSLEYPGNPGNWVEPIFGRPKAASDPCD